MTSHTIHSFRFVKKQYDYVARCTCGWVDPTNSAASPLAALSRWTWHLRTIPGRWSYYTMVIFPTGALDDHEVDAV